MTQPRSLFSSKTAHKAGSLLLPFAPSSLLQTEVCPNGAPDSQGSCPVLLPAPIYRSRYIRSLQFSFFPSPDVKALLKKSLQGPYTCYKVSAGDWLPKTAYLLFCCSSCFHEYGNKKMLCLNCNHFYIYVCFLYSLLSLILDLPTCIRKA